MPRLNGVDAVIKIREYEKELNIKPSKVIIISACSSKADIDDLLMRQGKVLANRFVQKPVIFNDLSYLIVSLFENEY
jgi:CheY-like chemotaxis protein